MAYNSKYTGKQIEEAVEKVEKIEKDKASLFTQVPAGGTTSMDVTGVGILLVQPASFTGSYFLVVIGTGSVTITDGTDYLSDSNESGKINISVSNNVITLKNNAASPLVIRAYFLAIS